MEQLMHKEINKYILTKIFSRINKMCSTFIRETRVWTFAYVHLLNKPYENEVISRGQNIPSKCCQPLDF